MYEDDHYHPNNTDFDNKFSIVKKIKKNCHSKFVKDKNGKRRKIEFYSTFETMGNPIKNAITGKRYPDMLTGTKCEELFFKVKVFVKNDYEEKEKGCTLFYNDPKEFEKHHNIFMDPSKKENWYKRNLDYYSSILKNDNLNTGEIPQDTYITIR